MHWHGTECGEKPLNAPGHITGHIPVLLQEVVSALAPAGGETIVDATFGAGGYASALLDAGAGRIIGIDRDPDAVAGGAALAAASSGRLTLVEGRFGELDALARDAGCAQVDGVVLDIGVSSMQLDQAERGFSFQNDGPLDMRMSQAGASAADLVNGLGGEDLARVFWLYGEEKKSRAIAAAIIERRAETPFETTLDLAGVVAACVGRRKDDKHPATRTFQALRIAVNRELDELVAGLFAAERVLKPGGRLVVVTFHSLEDRIVKRFVRSRSEARPRGSRHVPEAESPRPSFQIVNHRPVMAGEEEVNANPRARSARLRTAIRLDGPAHAGDLRGLGLPNVKLEAIVV